MSSQEAKWYKLIQFMNGYCRYSIESSSNHPYDDMVIEMFDNYPICLCWHITKSYIKKL